MGNSSKNMKKKIAILGSTGSIGKKTLDIIKKDKKRFIIYLLVANKNSSLLIKQIKEFNPKNIIISDYKSYKVVKKKFKKKNIYNNFNKINSIFKSKIDYTMSAISGFNGLKPTLEIIKFSKTIAIANKESIICGWNLINKELKKNKTNFIPIDSEHFSIWSLIKNSPKESIDKIIITASGGPFLKKSHKQFRGIKPSDAIKHPNWKMGKKISIDSATLMNKIFEVIEAKKIFNIKLNKFKILIHPQSYIHAIIKFKNGLIKIIAHDTDMKIPIFNSLYNNENKAIISKNINLQILNNLELQEVDQKKFPVIKILDKIPDNESLFETLLVTINDELVDLFLTKQVSFQNISKNLIKFLNLNVFAKYKRQKLNNLAQIVKLNKFVRLKTKTLSIL
tara:strand:+ start:325 stop:1506 length:1182 start_codon:yes stop_codon:yes gene_type:complete